MPSLISIIAAALVALIAGSGVACDLMVQLSESSDIMCRGARPSVAFNSGACATWSPGTSQLMKCSSAPVSGCRYIAAAKFNGSDASCSKPVESVPIECGQCAPMAKRGVPTGKYFIIKGCEDKTSAFAELECDSPSCTSCSKRVQLKFKECMLKPDGGEDNWLFLAPERCSFATLHQWASNENCDGIPDASQKIILGACSSGDGVGGTYSCVNYDTANQHQNEKVAQPPPPLLRRSRAAPEPRGIRITQCDNLRCNGNCHDVAIYFESACVTYGGEPTSSIRFSCAKSDVPDRICVSDISFNNTRPGAGTCAESAAAGAGTLVCGKDACSIDKNTSAGTYFSGCVNGSMMLNGGCNATCDSCAYQLPLTQNGCNDLGSDSSVYIGLPYLCRDTVSITQWQTPRCRSGASQLFKVAVGDGMCSSGEAHVATQYACVGYNN